MTDLASMGLAEGGTGGGGEPAAVGPDSRAMPFEEYRLADGVNWSTLKHMAVSPLHYRHALKRQPSADTAAMLRGRAVHTAVLEPERFTLDYAVWTGARRAGKEYDGFVTANAGRTILKDGEYGEAQAIAAAVRAHPFAARVLESGQPERVIEWFDEETSIACKARLDWLMPTGFADLKTARTLDRRRFSAAAYDLGYHGQLAFYRRGLQALGMEEPAVWMLAVETVEPYDVAVWTVDPLALEAGDETVGTLLRRLVECQATQEWPGRYPGVETFYLPAYAYSTEDESGDLGLTINEEEP